MTVRIGEFIHERLGWCPAASPQACTTKVRPVGEIDATPSGPDCQPAIPAGWFERYRNWLLFWAVFYIAFTPCYVPLYLAGGGQYLPFLLTGILAALLVFLLNARRMWRQYDTALAEGACNGTGTWGGAALYIMISVVIFLIGFEILVFAGIVRGIDFLVLPAIMVGFSVLPLFVLGLVLIWESETGARLYFRDNCLYVPGGG